MPQIGPGKGDGFAEDYWQATGYVARLEDRGRERVSRQPEDRYRFRTPSLRNVALTAPYGHSGAYDTLEEAVRHHLDPVRALEAYRHDPVRLPAVAGVRQAVATGSSQGFQQVNPARAKDFKRRDGWVQESALMRAAIASANELAPRSLSEADVAEITAFLEALTDPRSRDLSHLIPARVPSGLPVAD
jgi:cytochrome c peroxidase